MVGIDLGLVDYAGIGHQILQLGYLELQQSLGLLGGVVLCILGEVSLIPCLGNLSGYYRSLAYSLCQFGLEFIKTF